MASYFLLSCIGFLKFLLSFASQKRKNIWAPITTYMPATRHRGDPTMSARVQKRKRKKIFSTSSTISKYSSHIFYFFYCCRYKWMSALNPKLKKAFCTFAWLSSKAAVWQISLKKTQHKYKKTHSLNSFLSVFFLSFLSRLARRPSMWPQPTTSRVSLSDCKHSHNSWSYDWRCGFYDDDDVQHICEEAVWTDNH